MSTTYPLLISRFEHYCRNKFELISARFINFLSISTKMRTIYVSKWVYERKRVNVFTMVKVNKKEYDRECTRSE